MSLSAQRMVLDTHVWLDWLVFNDPSVAAIRRAREEGRAALLIDGPCEAELARVLAYDLGRFSIGTEAQAERLAECRRLAERIVAELSDAERAQLPRCRDRDDQIFLEAALAGRAHLLLTKDRALLHCARAALPFRIVTPQQYSES
jgi:predicted nucleic acid-binding protein